MTDLQRPEWDNEKALRKLARAIQLSLGGFHLIFARCNSGTLREQMIEELRKICEFDINILHLKESEKDFYNVIRQESNDGVQVLIIVGLESLHNLPQFLTATNSMHFGEFHKNFSFPSVLWIDNDIDQQMMKLAPDFRDWATRINFPILS
jgi:hypothetical protein